MLAYVRLTAAERMSLSVWFFFQAEDGIRDLVRSRGLGDVYKRQGGGRGHAARLAHASAPAVAAGRGRAARRLRHRLNLSLIHI